MLWLVLPSVIAGCGGAQLAATHTASNETLNVSWSALVDTPPCFYFSGPEDLGRNDHLGRRAALSIVDQHVRLDFGSNILFDGELQGDRVTLHRSSSHDYDTGKWEAEETITLQATASTWVGHYHYDERDPETHAVGRCHIDASVHLTP